MNDIDEVVLPEAPVTEAAAEAPAPTAGPQLATAAQVSELADSVQGLRDLFARRLLEDKAKNGAFNELYDQLKFAREGLVRTTVTPLVSELVLVIDRIDQSGASDAMIASVREELLEILARRSVTPIVIADDTFDASLHEAVAMVDTDGPAGRIVSVERTGYRYGAQLLRPAQVKISRAAQ